MIYRGAYLDNNSKVRNSVILLTLSLLHAVAFSLLVPAKLHPSRSSSEAAYFEDTSTFFRPMDILSTPCRLCTHIYSLSICLFVLVIVSELCVLQ